MKRVFALFISLMLAAPFTSAHHVTDTLGTASAAASSAATLLEGRISGVRVLFSDGSFNGQQLVHIRGLNSLRSDSHPLWIVDGTIVNQGLNTNLNAFYQTGETTSSGDILPDYNGRSHTPALDGMEWLNLQDIESIEVLKDISATAIYGSKGANGVIIIKTRRGSRDSASIRVNASAGINSSYQHGDAFRTGFTQNYNAAISGSTSGGITYNTSLFLRQTQGTVNGESMLKGGLGLNIETKTHKTFWFGLNARLSAGNNSYPAGTADIGSASLMTLSRNPEAFTDENLQGWMADYDDQSNDYRMTGSAYVRVNFLPSLSLNVTGGIDYYNNKRYIWYGNGTSFGKDFNGAAAILNTAILNFNAKASLDFERHFDSVHHLSASIAGEAIMNDIRNNCMNGSDITFHQLRAKSISASNSRNSIRKIYQTSEILGAHGLFRYDYSKYAGVQLSLNTDWNIHFDKSPELFPAANAYVSLKDILLSNSKSVNSLSITGGWGSAGNDNSIPLIIGREQESVLPEVPAGAEEYFDCLNRAISKEWNVGITAGFINRIDFSLKYYDKSTEDRFQIYDFSHLGSKLYEEAPSGSLFHERVSSIRNRGVEFDANATLVNRSGFRWTLYADASYNTASATLSEEDASDALNYLDKTIPKFLTGLGTSVNVSNFSIEAKLSSAAGYSIIDANRYIGQSFTGFTDSDLKPADYLKLDHVSVAYSIPLHVKWLKSLRVHLTGKNLLMISRYDGWNPIVNCFANNGFMYGVDYGSYPMTRSIILGLNLLF